MVFFILKNMHALYIADLKISIVKPAKNLRLSSIFLEKYPVVLDENENITEYSKKKLALKHLKTLEFCNFEIKNIKFSSKICY